MILSANSYILHKSIAKKLAEYYKYNKIHYHIDFHLAFVLKSLNINLYSFKKQITYPLSNYTKSSMTNHNKKFLLKYVEDYELYKYLLTPVMRIKLYELNCYFCILIIILIDIVLLSLLIKNNILVCILWFLFGLLVWDLL